MQNSSNNPLPTRPHRNPEKKKSGVVTGLSVVAIILGGLGLFIGILPFVGAFGIVLAIVALIFAVPALITAYKEKVSTSLPTIAVCLALLATSLSLFQFFELKKAKKGRKDYHASMRELTENYHKEMKEKREKERLEKESSLNQQSEYKFTEGMLLSTALESLEKIGAQKVKHAYPLLWMSMDNLAGGHHQYFTLNDGTCFQLKINEKSDPHTVTGFAVGESNRPYTGKLEWLADDKAGRIKRPSEVTLTVPK